MSLLPPQLTVGIRSLAASENGAARPERRPAGAVAGTQTGRLETGSLETVADLPQTFPQPNSAPARGDTDGPASDAQLVARLASQDALAEAALGALYDRHAGSVYALLLRLLGHSSAQEVVQDVFLRLWQAPGKYDPDRADLRAYLLVMARSRALDRLRQERGEWRLYDDQGQDFPLPDERQDLFSQAASAEQQAHLARAMTRLSEAQRETVRRAFLLGESREETAHAMGVPVGTVKSRLNTALGHLKRVLAGTLQGGDQDE
ncbi:RNA polymerase sigma factor [Deinococcus altitudinis]|uniref:RNA polymerase sigma factor n=1 Tax=Deinococcus altitudinis TaxID=468914 RepID=UPI003891E287